jgi:hypothetical protein
MVKTTKKAVKLRPPRLYKTKTGRYYIKIKGKRVYLTLRDIEKAKDMKRLRVNKSTNVNVINKNTLINDLSLLKVLLKKKKYRIRKKTTELPKKQGIVETPLSIIPHYIHQVRPLYPTNYEYIPPNKSIIPSQAEVEVKLTEKSAQTNQKYDDLEKLDESIISKKQEASFDPVGEVVREGEDEYKREQLQAKSQAIGEKAQQEQIEAVEKQELLKQIANRASVIDAVEYVKSIGKNPDDINDLKKALKDIDTIKLTRDVARQHIPLESLDKNELFSLIQSLSYGKSPLKVVDEMGYNPTNISEKELINIITDIREQRPHKNPNPPKSRQSLRSPLTQSKSKLQQTTLDSSVKSTKKNLTFEDLMRGSPIINNAQFRARIAEQRKGVNGDDDETEIIGSGLYSRGGLWSDQLEKLLRKHTSFPIPVISSDQVIELADRITPKTKLLCWIQNTAPSTEQGEHWIFCAIDLHKHQVIYDDSLVSEPPLSWLKQVKYLIDKMKVPYYLKLKVNRIKNQSDLSDNCGYFAIEHALRYVNGEDLKEFTLDESDIGEKDIKEFKSWL